MQINGENVAIFWCKVYGVKCKMQRRGDTPTISLYHMQKYEIYHPQSKSQVGLRS